MNPVYLLAWLPERLLNEKGQTEWDKFISIEEKTTDGDEEEGPPSPCAARTRTDWSSLDAVLIDMPFPRPETYAFSVPLSSIYSLIVQPPTLSSWSKHF